MTRQRKTQLAWVAAAFLTVVCLDQAAKAYIIHTIPLDSVHYTGRERDFFWITHERNPGLVGGLFRTVRPVAMAAPIFATAVLGYLFFHLDPTSRFQALSYGLIAGGAVGNLIDRLRFGYVVDFLQVYFWFVKFNFPWKLYPAFNLADSAICTGVFLLILSWRKVGEPSAESSHVSDNH